MKQIGRELNVRYVLEGSVQRGGNRMRVNVQLIDAENGAHLWAERFDKPVADLFDMQDEIVARLANTLGYELTKAEAERSAHSKNPDAIDLVMRGWALNLRGALKNPTKDNNNAMRALFEQALNIDPNNSEALVGDATTYWFEYMHGWGNSETDYDAKILGQVERAVALDPDNVWAYGLKSYYLGLSRRFNEAVRAADAGLAVNPNIANLYACATYRRDVPRAFRTSENRHTTSDAVKSARSGYGHLATAVGRGRT